MFAVARNLVKVVLDHVLMFSLKALRSVFWTFGQAIATALPKKAIVFGAFLTLYS